MAFEEVKARYWHARTSEKLSSYKQMPATSASKRTDSGPRKRLKNNFLFKPDAE